MNDLRRSDLATRGLGRGLGRGLVRGGVALAVGLVVLMGQAAPSTAQTPSPLTSPPGAAVVTTPRTSPTARPSPTGRAPTPTMTLLPTHTPLPTFTPLPPATIAPVVTASPPVQLAPAPDPAGLLIVLGVLALVVAGLALLALRRILNRQQRSQQATQPIAPVKPIEPPPPAAASITFTTAAGDRLSFLLDKPSLTLGRSTDNDIVIPAGLAEADTVSGHHAHFRRDQDDIIVRDLGSRNGLMVNGRHTNHNLLKDGDRLTFGAVEAIFHKPGGGAA